MVTVGESVERNVKECFEIYKYFKKDPKFSDKAERLAKADLQLERIVVDMSLRKFEELLKKE